MPRLRRKLFEAAEEAATPPDKLIDGQVIAQVMKMSANNLVEVKLPDGKELLVELSGKFRNTIWIRRGGYVLVDLKAFEHRENKLDGEIVNVIRDEKDWRKKPYWPKEFVKKSLLDSGSDEESNVGKMPSSDSESDG